MNYKYKYIGKSYKEVIPQIFLNSNDHEDLWLNNGSYYTSKYAVLKNDIILDVCDTAEDAIERLNVLKNEIDGSYYQVTSFDGAKVVKYGDKIFESGEIYHYEDFINNYTHETFYGAIRESFHETSLVTLWGEPRAVLIGINDFMEWIEWKRLNPSSCNYKDYEYIYEIIKKFKESQNDLS